MGDPPAAPRSYLLRRVAAPACPATGVAADRHAGKFQAQPALRSPRSGRLGEAGEAILRDLMASTPRLQRFCIDRVDVAQGPHASAWGMSSRDVPCVVGDQVPQAESGRRNRCGAEGGLLSTSESRASARLLLILQAEACSGRKSQTEGGYARFDLPAATPPRVEVAAQAGTDRNERHHGDALWALALAVRAAGVTGKETRKRRVVQASVI